jgi:hypothetical protein
MEFGSLLPRVALALGIGLLIGLERGWRTRAADVASDTVSKVAIGAIIGRGRFAAEIGMVAILCRLLPESSWKRLLFCCQVGLGNHLVKK